MILKILPKYAFGYVKISVEGYYIERFINTCISRSVLLWNVKREKLTYMHANVGIKEYKMLKQIAKKTNCKIKIEGKKGVPFIMNRYRKRKIFFILLIVIILSMYGTSKFVWNIEIEGTNNIPKEEIITALEQNGLKIGTMKRKIDTQEIINKIRLERDDIAWMNIDLRGTNIIVKIVETTKKPEIVKQDEYCNIVSNKKGQITKITATSGTTLVKVRRYSYGKHNLNRWLDGRKIHRNTICSWYRRDRGKSVVQQKRKNGAKSSIPKENRKRGKEI